MAMRPWRPWSSRQREMKRRRTKAVSTRGPREPDPRYLEQAADDLYKTIPIIRKVYGLTASARSRSWRGGASSPARALAGEANELAAKTSMAIDRAHSAMRKEMKRLAGTRSVPVKQAGGADRAIGEMHRRGRTLSKELRSWHTVRSALDGAISEAELLGLTTMVRSLSEADIAVSRLHRELTNLAKDLQYVTLSDRG